MVPTGILIPFFVTILLMAFFAGIEMAYYSANRFGVELRRKQNRPGAHLLSKLLKEQETFLAATSIGFALSLVLFVLLLDAVTAPLWSRMGVDRAGLRIGLDILLAAFVVLVLGEFMPRSLFRAHANPILARMVWLINGIYQLLQPLASLFLGISKWILQYIFNVRVGQRQELFIRTDMDTLFSEGNGDEFEPEEMNTEMFEAALELPKTRVRQCLVPRKEIVAVAHTATVGELRQKMVDTKLSRLPVYEGTIDTIRGYVHQLDLFKNPASIADIMHPIPAVPESMSVSDLIGKLTRDRKSIAWVVDEFGGTAGIVTMEDLLEEIFGEIRDEYDADEFVERQLSDTEYMLSGRLELDYLAAKFNFHFPPEEDSETLSGFIIAEHGKIPAQKERILTDRFEFDILAVSDTRIEMVKMKVLR